MWGVWTIAGSLTPVPVLDRLDLVAEPVAAALRSLPDGSRLAVAEIDPGLADTAEFCAHYGSPLAASANCVVVAGKRGDTVRYAACVVLATTRADVNGVVRRRLDARKASFAPMDEAVSLSGMEYGGITPVGLPADWPVLLSPEVVAAPELVIGSGVRGSKLLVPGEVLAKLPGAEVVEGLAR
ncbi:YbaK/EbsC family protein [Saccharothrix sp. BKS2]|uniref:YbaK/EbsC family protein n=1 Tax=Saccharothrix sp. BKS2 TaxID=3064400 RepID=UPI0039E98A4D